VIDSSRDVAVIGGGPAGLMAAEVLAQGGARVTVYERMPSAGRKFLLAGRGGLNLTHSEALPDFLARYGEAVPRLAAAIEALPPVALRQWCEDLGSRPSWDRAAACSRNRSSPRRCCGPGSGGSAQRV
jgi:predicted flavoprotein YhiN